jgi:acyl carrier protein
MEIKGMIKQYILNELVQDERYTNLSDHDPLIETGIIDSLGIMKLIGFLENTLSIHVDDTELIPENFTTVQAIYSMVSKKVA